MTDVYGWHFGSGTLGYQDGRRVVVGETLTIDVKPVLCRAGLHASVNALNALRNAQSAQMAYRVRLSGKIAKPTKEHPDKHAATERTVLAGVEFGPIAQMFIRDTLAYRQPYLVALFERAGDHDYATAIGALDMYGDIKTAQMVLHSAYAAAADADAYISAAAAAAAYSADSAAAAAAAAAYSADSAAAAADADAARKDLSAILEKRLYRAMGITSRRKTVKR